MTRTSSPNEQDTGASADADRATRPADQAPTGLGDTASVTSAAFTPGPWDARPHDGGFIVVHRYAPGDGSLVTEFIAECRGKPRIPNEANAHLIAAAPELYEVLEEFVRIARLPTSVTRSTKVVAPSHVYRRAVATLAKARGEQ